MFRFFVKGRPVPQGSLKFIHGRPIHERAADLAVWRADIARMAEQNGCRNVDKACTVKLDFIFAKPKSVKRALVTVRPDLDKLIRAVLDGLTGTAFIDDSQVIEVMAQKRYGDIPGVWIGINYYENA